MDKIFEKLPYDFLEGVKFLYILLSAVGVGVVFLSIYYFTVSSANQQELAQLQQQRAQKEQTLKTYRELVARKDPIAKELARSLGQLEFMKRQLPREDDMPDLLKKVADFGGGRGAFDVLRFQLKEGEVKDFYKEIPRGDPDERFVLGHPGLSGQNAEPPAAGEPDRFEDGSQ